MRKICLMILAIAFVVGTLVSVIPVKASPGPVRFFIKDLGYADSNGDNIYSGKTPPPPFPPPLPNLKVQVLIESPLSWMNTSDGIIGYMVSVRVDPRALTAVKIAAPTMDIQGDTYPDDFLGMYAAYQAYMGNDVTTLAGAAAVDAASGTMYGFAYALTGTGWRNSLGGAGGNIYDQSNIAAIAELQFLTKSATQKSLIDLMGPGRSTEQIVKGIEVSCKYTNAKGETYRVEPEDGYYVNTVQTMYFDSTAAIPTGDPKGSVWHELAPTYSQQWSLDYWNDKAADGKLSLTDEIGVTQLVGGSPGLVTWGTVDWLNTQATPNDGVADMIITLIAGLEFPLGVEPVLLLALIIPVAYIWRQRKKSR